MHTYAEISVKSEKLIQTFQCTMGDLFSITLDCKYKSTYVLTFVIVFTEKSLHLFNPYCARLKPF